MTILWVNRRHAVAMVIGVLLAGGSAFGAPVVEHALKVSVEPESALLVVADHVRVPGGYGASVPMRVAPRVTSIRVDVSGQTLTPALDAGHFTVPIQPSEDPTWFTLHYTLTADDPVPKDPVYTDNPGYGVTGTIGPEGVFFLPGSRWYPISGPQGVDTYSLRLSAPAGMVAVTGGQRQSVETRGGRTITRWSVGRPVAGLALMAGYFHVRERSGAGATAVTYFTPALSGLSDGYLESTTAHLDRYAQRFGAYPFPAFSVVENFFPTGYGFPGYTVIGSRVLRLPFIRHTSLAHEIAHCWWGNGVLVDSRQGNWSEGLTTYVADYMLHEDRGPEAARAHRRRMIQNVTVLAPAGRDFPLRRFSHRTDPVSRAVGYDKGAMVFHMLRQRVGEAAFWAGLRSVADRFMFKQAGWADFRQAMESASGMDLTPFFNQWVARSGLPQLHLANVRHQRQGAHWAVTGEIRQTAPHFNLSVALTLATETGPVTQAVSVSGPRTPFILAAEAPPQRLSADPGFNLLRRLAPEEIPVTINAFKTKGPLIAVVPDGLDSAAAVSARLLAAGFGRPIRQWLDRLPEPDADPGSDIIMVLGRGGVRPGYAIPKPVTVDATGFRVADTQFNDPRDALFCAFEHQGRRVGLLVADADAEILARKIPHYGTFSYLVFQGGANRTKAVWSVDRSPMIHRFGAL